jgi:hypothetical protein
MGTISTEPDGVFSSVLVSLIFECEGTSEAEHFVSLLEFHNARANFH